MHISYQPLWNTLKERGMRKEDLRLAAGLTTNMIANMGKGKNISMETLVRICKALNCGILDVIELEPDEGEIIWGQTITHTYFPKDNNYLFETDETITDWLRKYSKDPDETYVRSFLGRMLFSGEEALKKAKVISGGEKVRCVLSKMMLSGANFLIMDEPTNHLDMESITSVNEGMKKFKGNIIFTSHDHELTQTVANRIIDLKQDGKVIDREITYNEYLGIE